MAYYTREQIAKAREMDLLTWLRLHDPGELMPCKGGEYRTRTHDSLTISNGKWMWWSRGIGGRSALDYLVKVRGEPFTEAVKHVLDEEGKTSSFVLPEERPSQVKAKRLLLPERSPNVRRVMRYLTCRGIDRKIVEACIEKDILYESLPYHNSVFVGFDSEGKARYASYRACVPGRLMGDVSGSDKRYSFRIEGSGSRVHLFESAIDLLSYATMREMDGLDWKREHLLSLSGVYQPRADPKESRIPVAVEQFLEEHPGIREIVLHLDSDAAGRNASRVLGQILGSRYQVRDEPPQHGKDCNDELLFRLASERKRERSREER